MGVAMVVVEGSILVSLIIPYLIQMNLKALVAASLMLEVAELTLMHLRVMVIYIEFVVVFL